MIKRIALFAVTIAITSVGFGTSYLSGYTATSNGYTWHYYCDSYYVSDGEAYIDGEDIGGDDVWYYISTFHDGKKPLGSVTIPTYLNGKLVVGIGLDAFDSEDFLDECGEITSLTIPSSIRWIYASFYKCTKLVSFVVDSGNPNFASYDGVVYDKTLTSIKYFPPAKTSVSFPATLTKIGGLSGRGFKSIVIPEGVTSIEDSAFSGCSELVSVSFPSTLRKIGNSAFSGCKKLTSISIPNGLTAVGENAFLGCSALKSISLPSSVTSIGDYAFSSCDCLESVTSPIFPKRVYEGTNYEYRVWYGDDYGWHYGSSFATGTSLYDWYFHLGEEPEVLERHITPVINPIVPNGTMTLMSNAFKGNGMSAITLPNTLRKIGVGAFEDCAMLGAIGIPSSVTNIGREAFCRCSNLSRVDITDLSSWCAMSFVDRQGNPLYWAHKLYVNGVEATAVDIPSSVINVGSYVFAGWRGLNSVKLHGDVSSIGDGAFYDCSGLSSVTIPENVSKIGDHAFYGCTGLKRVEISNLEKWCGIDFESATANPLSYANHLVLNGLEVSALNIPYTVSSVGDYAFCGASSISSVDIPSNVEYIGTQAFSGCSSMQSVTIAAGLSAVGESAFSGCTSLNRIKIADLSKWCLIMFANETANPLSSGHRLFLNDEEIVSLVIPASVQSIGKYAFVNATGIESVTIPQNVVNIGVDAFKGCTALSCLNIRNLSMWCDVFFENCHANPLACAKRLYVDNEEVTSLIIPDGVAKIENYAFYNADGVTSVVIPASVTSVDSKAFSGCTGVRSADIPASFNFAKLFPESCGQIERLKIPEGTTEIAANAYKGCGGIIEVVIPASVTNIGSNAFADCEKLTKVEISDLAKWCVIHFSDSGANPLAHNGNLILDGSLVKDLIIPAEACNVAKYAFYNSTGIVSVTIPTSVTNVSYSAFWGCTGIRQIEAPSTYKVSSLFPDAYKDITNVIIVDTMSGIAEGAYKGCSSLTRIAIPESVTAIGASAFEGCSSLVRVDVADIAKWCGITFENSTANPLAYGHHLYAGGSEVIALEIPSGVLSIADYAFYNASSIVSVTIPSSVTSIGPTSFLGCTGIRTIDIPASYRVKMVFPSAYSTITQMTIPEWTMAIEANAYQGCSSMTAVEVPASVTTIGSGAFRDCGNLKSVTFKGQAPTCGDDVFIGTSADLVVYAGTGTSGWTQWNGRPLAFVDSGSGSGGESAVVEKAQLTVTNIVIHYIVNSVMPEKVYPAVYDVGFVNIITEVKSGGAVSVPATWMVNYPGYIAKFGGDFTKSLMKPTGKTDGAGNAMLVWQDYVAGTDPTDEEDVFTASITMVDGKPVISYSPELSDAEKALRVYRTWGKVKLQDVDWVEIPSGKEGDYNFFKVTVEMK